MFKDALAAVKEGRKHFLEEAIAIRKNGKVDDDLEPEDLDDDYSSDDAVTVDANML